MLLISEFLTSLNICANILEKNSVHVRDTHLHSLSAQVAPQVLASVIIYFFFQNNYMAKVVVDGSYNLLSGTILV